MSLLDDLKKEAHRLQEVDSANREEAQRDALYEERFKQPMQAILHYLSELTDQLAILNHEARYNYTLPGIGEVADLRHIDYVVNTDSSDNPKTIRLRFACESDKEMEFPVMPKPKADETRHFLESQRMRYAEWPIRDYEQRIVGLNFQMKTRVNVSFVVQTDLEIGSIKLFVSNFSGFKIDESLIQPENVDDSWLDRFGNYILRNRASLYDLDIDESHKVDIRKRLQESERMRQEELQQAIKDEQEEHEEAYRRSLLGKLKMIAERLER
ncbi:MAG: hypothetical protein KZQ91_13645 [Candidatus Thiodiazotropha sp. (ex Lucinoma borealis)]|nr:hypothetical protein [Candidatus Thiodiazotropha sp. (ex Lucinoma borealis)]